MNQSSPPSSIEIQFLQYSKQWQKFLDTLTPYTIPRWSFTGVLIIIFFLRIIFVQGWYVVAYALSIYLLNLFLAFITPKFDPSLAESEEIAEGPALPTKMDEEFKPFIRRLPEFKFWYWSTRASLIAFVCSFISLFDIPVFWPVLRQIKHMMKHKYIPFDIGKRKYSTQK
ncbi:Retrieval of early ER protein Rer1 domain-containing protein [Rozella allomycis CSF55]|uniref:Protein RER1 n=1 Tax=Rozella allomycis (strain CSF55) TaxID=988480 RepID=A0A075AT67_ROZAC|nr:Retrieval of early ER protein Rer1 domain-containing protein [Rozella allomycis CSF55]|eukprot:EPZ33453.1 Retrieval of early ER protein Rer1 domain-containing protein [Rozella allomycis CSF55]